MTTFDVQPGDIYSLGGKHRLACGDATNKEDVKRLFDGRKPTLVVTSPPYAKQRDYDRPIACWDSMMLGALDGHELADSVQMFINLGVIHTKGEWTPYWWHWLQKMRDENWQHAGLYIWDKLSAIPGANIGTPRPCHEFIFHFRKQRSLLNLTESCKWAGTEHHGLNLRGKDNTIKRRGSPNTTVKSHRVIDSVLRIHPERRRTQGHPAVFPVSLPKKIISAWKTHTGIVYDCFAGSGTTMHAAEQEGVTGLAMEISPAYTAIALARWAKAYPEQPIIKVAVAP